MLAHNVNDYINQRRQHLQLKEKNLYTKNKHLMNEERTTYKPNSMYGTAPIEEKVYFDTIKKGNAIRANNDIGIYDANNNLQKGISIIDEEQDNRTTKQKMEDEQYMKDAVYKYATDLLKDREETAKFVDSIYNADPKYIPFFIQHFATIKQNLGSIKLLTANFLENHITEYYEKIKDTALVDRPLTKTVFNEEMKNYTPPSAKQLKELRGILAKMKKIDPDMLNDVINRVDAIGAIVDRIDTTQQNQIQTDLPNREIIDQILTVGKSIHDRLDAAEFMNQIEDVLKSVTADETQKVFALIEQSTDSIQQQISGLYTAPSIDMLQNIQNKINNMTDVTNDTKESLLFKIDALMTTVSNLPRTTFQSRTPIPSEEAFEELSQTRSGTSLFEEVTKLLTPVTPKNISKLLVESQEKQSTNKSDDNNDDSSDDNEEYKEGLSKLSDVKKVPDKKLSTAREFSDRGVFQLDKLINDIQRAGLSYDNIRDLDEKYAIKYLNEPYSEEMKQTYDEYMTLLGFVPTAKKQATMESHILSKMFRERNELVADTIAKVNKMAAETPVPAPMTSATEQERLSTKISSRVSHKPRLKRTSETYYDMEL